jgi:hypothetical protein
MRNIGLVRSTIIAIIAATAFAAIVYSNRAPSVVGNWTFKTQGVSSCEMPYNGWKIVVQQEGNTFSGSGESEGPEIRNGIIVDNIVTFAIILENNTSPDGYGDFSELEGTLSGKEISGTIVGHDSEKYCVWDGNFTVTISE